MPVCLPPSPSQLLVLSFKMPTVQAPAKVLVSGENGFVAVWIVQNLLDHGYSVRGTVRSTEKGEHLKKIFAKYGDKHEVVVVEDMTKVSLTGPFLCHGFLHGHTGRGVR